MRYQKGQSGNVNGRPPGSLNARGLVSAAFATYKEKNNIDAVNAIISSLIEQALAGDVGASKLLLERIEPSFKPVSRTVTIAGCKSKNLFEKAEKILAAAMDGIVAVDEAKQLLSSLADIVKIKEITELESRLEALENV